jgi:ABC-2 type transport system ATP-binding protein
VRERLIKNLSKGYRQRVGLAQALVNLPEILILDEPTVGLDPKQITEVRDLIKELSKEHTVILSSHILSEVQAVCDRILILSKGRIVADERTEDLKRSMASATQLSVLIRGARGDVTAALQSINGAEIAAVKDDAKNSAVRYQLRTAGGEDPRVAVFNVCKDNNWPILAMEETAVSLEDVFLTLTETKDAKPAKGSKKGANA